jgi:hypothetical protein
VLSAMLCGRLLRLLRLWSRPNDSGSFVEMAVATLTVRSCLI